jgi:hypothetical protein
MNSASVFAGTLGAITRTNGTLATSATGAKLLIGS